MSWDDTEMNALVAIEELREVLASTSPGAVGSPAGRKLTEATERITLEEFDRLEKRLPRAELKVFVQTEIALLGERQMRAEDKEFVEQRVAMIIEPVIHSEHYQTALDRVMRLAFMEAATQIEESADDLITEQAEAVGIVAGVRSLDIPREVRLWAQANSGFAVTGIDETTRRALAQTISQALDQPIRSAQNVAKAIADRFDQFDQNRALLIGNTEMNFAMSEGAFSRAQSLGSRTKAWLTVGDDRVSQLICQPNEANSNRTPIPLNDAFVSGHLTTPGHPRCRCVINYFGATRSSVDQGLNAEGRAAWLSSIAALAATVAIRRGAGEEATSDSQD